VHTWSGEGDRMYIITQSPAPFGWEKNSLAEHKKIKAGRIKMHQIYYF